MNFQDQVFLFLFRYKRYREKHQRSPMYVAPKYEPVFMEPPSFLKEYETQVCQHFYNTCDFFLKLDLDSICSTFFATKYTKYEVSKEKN